jgi:hypothetical protein
MIEIGAAGWLVREIMSSISAEEYVAVIQNLKSKVDMDSDTVLLADRIED